MRAGLFALLLTLAGWSHAATTVPLQITSSPISMVLVATRTSGVAPFGVIFSTVGTQSPSRTSKPFHEIQYCWDFGDDDTALWAYGAHIVAGVADSSGLAKKNRACSAIAAHVYETPGTYTAILTAFDGVNTATLTKTITVTDPDVVFAGTATKCLSSAADFTGCPTGASHITVSSNLQSLLTTYLVSGNRVLLKRGETHTVAASAAVLQSGPIQMADYGTGVKPTISAPNVVNGVIFLQLSAVDDFRIVNIIHTGADGNSETGRLVSQAATGGDASNLLVLRCEATGTGNLLGANGSAVLYNMIVQESYTSRATAFYGHPIYGAFIGNNFQAVNPVGTPEHIIRLQGADYVVISNNDIYSPKTLKHNIAIRGVPYTVPGDISQYADIADNKLTGINNDIIIQFAFTNASVNEFTSDIIVQRNWFIYGTATNTSVSWSISNVTIRNNITDMTGSTVGRQGWTLVYDTAAPQNAAPPWPANHYVYNNTLYFPGVDSGFRSFKVSPGEFGCDPQTLGVVSNVNFKNNLAYAPLSSAHEMQPISEFPWCGSQVTGVTQNNNSLTDTVGGNGVLVDPVFTSATPTTPAGFKVVSPSYAIGAGAAVPVWDDFFHVQQNATRTLGAIRP